SAAQLDLVVVPIPPGTAKGASATKPEGIALFPRFTGQLSATIELTAGVDLTFSGGIEDEGLIRAELRPSGSALKLAVAPQQLDFGAGVHWSTEEGLRFNGTATLRLELPVHLDLAGVVQIDTIHLVLGASAAPQGAQLEVSVTGGLTLGPLAAQVDRLGV